MDDPVKKGGRVIQLPLREGGRVQLRTQTPIAPTTFDGETSVMVRGVDGRIALWNRGAERSYGLLQENVIGRVSHCVLQTEFPVPLSEINQRLVRDQVWEGELIHTLSDGSRVKVLSRWELLPNTSGEPVVFEINREFFPLQPPQNTPPIAGLKFHVARIARIMWRKKLWWLIPIVVVSAFVAWAYHLTEIPGLPVH